jgi:hypothetical protein
LGPIPNPQSPIPSIYVIFLVFFLQTKNKIIILL